MNDNAKALVEALRSGEYDQARGGLHRESDGYCCLGVACDVYRKMTGEGKWVKTPIEFLGFQLPGVECSESAVLPVKVRDWLGFNTDSGDFSEYFCLATENDSGTSFEQIADLIENEPEGLFR